MSNNLSVRRVRVHTIDEKGETIGEPSFGVVASDDNGVAFNDGFETLQALNVAIAEAPSILSVADEFGEMFSDADHAKIGKGNFYGKDWR